ncbi:hypothetical protein E9529_09060 [Blastococcus sp. KM273128]|uniref:hypothetical protein n=1 Tax=Blastococcus sp. KM273128 TaxID=2570314 RepID=UPI001F2C83C5|nr:hypothetical protein [Blastococcus sp. KM273128]MCF6744423.1 hypothetical protein [Blastococcus sp. KM273128]
MAGIPLLVLTALLATVAVGTALAHRSPPSRERAVAAARVHAARSTAAAYLLGAAAAVVVGEAEVGNSAPGGLGVTVLLVPITFGVVHVAVLAAGELTWPRPRGEVRRARLVRRGLLDAAPRWLVRTTAVAAALAVVVVVAGALTAEPDGRSFRFQPDPTRATGGSPFPGLFYGRPAALGLLVLAVVAGVALWVVANRPAVATEDERIEAALRRASAHRVLRATAAVTAVVAGGLVLIAGMRLHSAGANTGTALLATAGTAVALLGLLAVLAGVVLCALRAPGVPADEPAPLR